MRNNGRDRGIELENATQGVLGGFYCAGPGRGFYVAVIVGLAGHHSDCLRELVGRVSQRLVLSIKPSRAST